MIKKLSTHFVFIFALGIILPKMSVKSDPTPSFSPGQVWSYNTRPNESDSYLTIFKIENLEKEAEVVHIRVDRVKIKNVHSKNGLATELHHIPLSTEALKKSVKTLLRETKESSKAKKVTMSGRNLKEVFFLPM